MNHIIRIPCQVAEDPTDEQRTQPGSKIDRDWKNDHIVLNEEAPDRSSAITMVTHRLRQLRWKHPLPGEENLPWPEKPKSLLSDWMKGKLASQAEDPDLAIGANIIGLFAKTIESGEKYIKLLEGYSPVSLQDEKKQWEDALADLKRAFQGQVPPS